MRVAAAGREAGVSMHCVDRFVNNLLLYAVGPNSLNLRELA